MHGKSVMVASWGVGNYGAPPMPYHINAVDYKVYHPVIDSGETIPVPIPGANYIGIVYPPFSTNEKPYIFLANPKKGIISQNEITRK